VEIGIKKTIGDGIENLSFLLEELTKEKPEDTKWNATTVHGIIA